MLSPQSVWQAAQMLPGGEEAIDIWRDLKTTLEQRGWTNFSAQDLQRCKSVGGKQVLKRQYM